MKEQKLKNGASIHDAKSVFKKMLSDKNRMRSYIQENGTLNGFSDDSIIFTYPI